MEGIGATVSQEVISRHRKHYKDGRPLAPKGTRKTDLAILVRDKVLDKVEEANGDELEAMLFTKEGQGAIGVGLKAQGILDSRERAQAKTGQTLELLAGLRAILIGSITAPPPQLDDGMTIEGAAVEVDDGSPE